jgi:hypothetical protein
MNTPTPTPRTDSAWAKTFDANGFLSGRGNAASQMRDACAKLERELTALTAERDRWREIAQTASAEREHNANVASAAIAERDQLRAALALGQINCDNAYDDLRTERDQLRADCENETKWAAHYLAQSIADKSRAERAEAELARLARPCGWPHCEPVKADHAELATEREKAERYRLVTLKLDAELATERARLDWLESDAGVDWQWSSSALTIRRAVIDAAMKEDAK